MARGVVKRLSSEEISVILDKRLRPAHGPQAQNSAAGSSAEGKDESMAQGGRAKMSQQHSWRLDKDEVASVFVRLRRNIMGELYYL